MFFLKTSDLQSPPAVPCDGQGLNSIFPDPRPATKPAQPFGELGTQRTLVSSWSVTIQAMAHCPLHVGQGLHSGRGIKHLETLSCAGGTHSAPSRPLHSRLIHK